MAEKKRKESTSSLIAAVIWAVLGVLLLYFYLDFREISLAVFAIIAFIASALSLIASRRAKAVAEDLINNEYSSDYYKN